MSSRTATASVCSRCIVTGVAVVLVVGAWALAARAQTPVAGSGRLDILVTSDGIGIAGATVCVGSATDLNLYFQGSTDTQGRVSVSPIPTDGFVVTAHNTTHAAQWTQGASTVRPPLLAVTLPLQSSVGARCPSVAPGPQRSLTGVVRPPPSSLHPRELTGVGRVEFCFGAVGMGCGQVPPGLPATAACMNGHCTINGGSWDHDTCCHANPGGYACAGGALDVTGLGPGSGSSTCRPEWDKAVLLTTRGLSWIRQVDFTHANATGTVEHALYCAPPDTLVPPPDGAKCCSRSVRALTPMERPIEVAKGLSLRACR